MIAVYRLRKDNPALFNRLGLAVQDFIGSEGKLSISECAKKHGISYGMMGNVLTEYFGRYTAPVIMHIRFR